MKVFFIAEAGVNHNGDTALALKMIDAAVRAGADAVKFQTFQADRLVVTGAAKAGYQIQRTGAAETQYEMLKKLELSREAHATLVKYCAANGIEFLSTPFDLESLDFLVRECGLLRIKIPSGEITNGPLLRRAAESGLPVILSTGMSELSEIEEALGVLAEGYASSSLAGVGQELLFDRVTLLHATTEYPAPFSEINLKAMDTMAACFNLPVGYSDHSSGISVSIAAVARGARVIEKHFTLDRTLPGPDHPASLVPDELAVLVKSIREVEIALGSAFKRPTISEISNRRIARKSLVAALPVHKGNIFSEENLTSKRPGSGLSPMFYWKLLGRSASRDYAPDDIIEEDI